MRLFVLLEAFFIAAIQVLVYAGAVMVLFLFVIMLLDIKASERRRFAYLGVLGGFAVAGWCGGRGCEARVKEDTKATIRLLPLDPTNVDGPCIVCGQPATEEATWARAY